MTDTTSHSQQDTATVAIAAPGQLEPKLVRASAGTGKTYQLTARLLQILMQGAAPESILATTFTRKAAGEILDRILLSLADAADPDNEDALEEFRAQVQLPSVPRSMCEQILKKLIANIHRVRIVTLDSLFTQLAKSFPFELQLPPAWRLTDEIEEGWIRQRAINEVIASLSPGEMTTMLSLLNKGDVKRSIVWEMTQVVDNAYGASRGCQEDVWSKLAAPSMPDTETLDRAAEAFRSASPSQKTLQKKFQTISERFESGDFETFSSDTLIKNYVSARQSGDEVKLGRSKLPDGLEEALGTLYSACRSRRLILLAAQNEGTGQVLQLYHQKVTELKTISRTLSFDDIAFRLAEQFSKIDPRSLGRRMDGAIDHVLLDEFQDTSPVQWQVLRPFAMRSAEPDPATDDESAIPRSFFCVGDTKQAIYGWRGGVAEIFDTVADQIPGVKTGEQNLSYRSSPVIMGAVNDIFSNLKRHSMTDPASEKDDAKKEMYEAKAVVKFARDFPEHAAAKKQLPGYVRLESYVSDDNKSEKTKAVFEYAADQIAKLHQESPDLSIGVLTRTNKAVAPLIFMLENLGVDVSQEGGNPLIDSAAVELVLSALMMAEHPGDRRWEYHVRQSPLGRNFESRTDSPAGKSFTLSADHIRALVTERGITRAVLKLCTMLSPYCDERDRSRLRQLVDLAMSYENNATPRLRDFVQMVREKRVDRPRSASVRVMTVHQSKGLEFDAVFLPELDWSLAGQTPGAVAERQQIADPPIAISRYLSSKEWHYLEASWRKAFGKDAGSRLNEALCLLYVAITRSRQGLYLYVHSDAVDDKRTPASLIKSALGPQLLQPPLEAENTLLLYQAGDPDWFRRP